MRSSVPLWVAFGVLILGVAMSRYPDEALVNPAPQVERPLAVQPIRPVQSSEPQAPKLQSKEVPQEALELTEQERQIHRSNWDFMTNLGSRVFVPYDEVNELGTNDFGESEYDFFTSQGDHVQQRFSVEGFPVEEVITMNDGSKLTRNYFDGSSRVQVVIYESDRGYRRIWYTDTGGYEAMEAGDSPQSTVMYRYDNDGKVREVWENGTDWKRVR